MEMKTGGKKGLCGKKNMKFTGFIFSFFFMGGAMCQNENYFLGKLVESK